LWRDIAARRVGHVELVVELVVATLYGLKGVVIAFVKMG
jgi:hypothetical protein